MQLLGGNWKKQDQDGSIKGSEEAAAKAFIAKLQGVHKTHLRVCISGLVLTLWQLALAIQQASNLINNPSIGGSTIASTFELFRENERSLPPRQSGDRSDIVHSLDTLWNMIFKHLSRNARDILSVVSFLSPDSMLIDLFLPRYVMTGNDLEKSAICSKSHKIWFMIPTGSKTLWMANSNSVNKTPATAKPIPHSPQSSIKLLHCSMLSPN